MRRSAEEIVAAGRALIGARFRPQGRSPTELDCVGLVALALEVERVPRDYALRGGSAARLSEELAKAGLRPAESARAGDVLVMRAGSAQLHLGIFTGAGLIHGDAGLRRVVERPGAIPWPIASIWRRHEWQP
ncbi:MAG TPA: NlpC/P60 family protein [Allosphingosinicella sp.]|nr:NlpC/P60 family protein [Allosphingosinicella sp.]